MLSIRDLKVKWLGDLVRGKIVIVGSLLRSGVSVSELREELRKLGGSLRRVKGSYLNQYYKGSIMFEGEVYIIVVDEELSFSAVAKCLQRNGIFVVESVVCGESQVSKWFVEDGQLIRKSANEVRMSVGSLGMRAMVGIISGVSVPLRGIVSLLAIRIGREEEKA